MKDINMVFSELAQYTRIMEEATATVDSLKDEIKQYMQAENVDTLTGSEHKATYKSVVSNRVDTKSMKASYPDIVQAYTNQTENKRFLFS